VNLFRALVVQVEPPAGPHQDPSVVWISLYNYLVTRNNGVEPGNMPKAFNEPDAPSTYPSVGGCPISQSVSFPKPDQTETHPNPSQIHTHTLKHVGKPDAERVRKSRKSLAEKTLVMAVPSGVASAGRKDPVMR